MTQIRTRIAPSPTGKMHIGTARTALFNKLFALANGGTYHVRIEDTDKERSTEENVTFIKDAFQWLHLTPDDDYVFQSAFEEEHKQAALKLIQEGKAYEDDGAIRFKIPEGITSWEDAIQGKISYKNEDLEDFVILRSNGTPTYHLGVVVDDARMGITHIIRGDDHINNTPKQILLHQALGNKIPIFAHLPLIHGEDGKKLSKRHGAVSVQDFRDKGILSNAFTHYLMQLSWLPGDDLTPTTLKEAAKKFDLKHISKGPARFDEKKMQHLNRIYLKELPKEEIESLLHMQFNIAQTKALPLVQEKAKSLEEIEKGLTPFLKAFPFHFSKGDTQTLQDGKKHLTALREFLTHEENWSAEELDTLIKSFITENNLKFPEVGKPLRLALTGEAHGLGLGDILHIFGQEESLKRLHKVT